MNELKYDTYKLMAHLPQFVYDLALLLITAGIVTIIFKWLKQPVVLGYIVAGLLISPHVGFVPNVIDMENVTVWAEIGVIFLLFALGLEFSFKKLMDVGGTASIATVINLGSMIIIGYAVGQLLGWSTMDCIFLGGMLSMSSTTIIIKAFNDMRLQKQKFAGIVFGMLIVEDLAAIVMMVLLSTLAVSRNFEGMELLEQVLKLVFFILIWFVVGIYLIPTILKKFKKHLNDETLLIVAVGMCLGMVLFASSVGFSAALGAFIMGSILAETVEAKHIEHLTEPIKNLFGAVFFVSVGMMISPAIIVEYAVPIAILTVIVLVGRIIFATLGVMASGEGLKVSVQSGFSLAQIGEFSFIIATLGMTLGVISDFLYPIIVAVSVITTFTTPYCIKISVPVYNYLEKRIPPKWNVLVTGYSNSGYKSINRQNDWNMLLKTVVPSMLIYFSLSIAIVFIFQYFVTPFIMGHIDSTGGAIISAVLCLLLMAPFMRVIMVKRNKSAEFRRLWNDSHFNKGALVSLIAFRICLCVALVLMVLIPLFPSMTALMVVISLIVTTAVILMQGFKKSSEKLETHFFENFNGKQNSEEQTIKGILANDLNSKDIHVEEIDIPQSSSIVGKTLAELNFKQTTGVNIVSIIRGDEYINIPDGNVRLYPLDKIVVVGSDEEVQAFMIRAEEDIQASQDHFPNERHVGLTQYIVEEDSPFAGKKVRELGIKEKTECMIVGINRENHSIADFCADTVILHDDVLWLAGEKSNLAVFADKISC